MNYYTDLALKESPPSPPKPEKLTRDIMANHPRVTHRPFLPQMIPIPKIENIKKEEIEEKEEGEETDESENVEDDSAEDSDEDEYGLEDGFIANYSSSSSFTIIYFL